MVQRSSGKRRLTRDRVIFTHGSRTRTRTEPPWYSHTRQVSDTSLDVTPPNPHPIQSHTSYCPHPMGHENVRACYYMYTVRSVPTQRKFKNVLMYHHAHRWTPHHT